MARGARDVKQTAKPQTGAGEVRGAELEPIRIVKRVLTRPDGTTVQVDVPVYPPFRLAERPDGTAGTGRRQAPSVRGRKRKAS